MEFFLTNLLNLMVLLTAKRLLSNDINRFESNLVLIETNWIHVKQLIDSFDLSSVRLAFEFFWTGLCASLLPPTFYNCNIFEMFWVLIMFFRSHIISRLIQAYSCTIRIIDRNKLISMKLPWKHWLIPIVCLDYSSWCFVFLSLEINVQSSLRA